MRSARWLVLLTALSGCYGQYDRGFDDGCYQGALDGAMWGGVDAALCYSANPVPGTPALGGGRYDVGFADGYDTCFPDAYLDAWDFALVSLEADLGPCEELQ